MTKYNYNFSIVTPGGCSSSCSFCTNPYNVPWDKEYISKLDKAINSLYSLPPEFNQVSVTGGEPTQSPVFGDIMYLLRQDRDKRLGRQFNKRVITTNGWKLDQWLDEVGDTFNHVNISRHAIGDEANQRVFGGTNIATDAEIQKYCMQLGIKGVDVNLNRVYDDTSLPLSPKELLEYISYAKLLGATKIALRYNQNLNSLEPSSLEKAFISAGFKGVEETECPVCRSCTYLIFGMYVTFKNSCANPSKELQRELYELIFLPDGNVYEDWEGEVLKGSVSLKKLKEQEQVRTLNRAPGVCPYMRTTTPGHLGRNRRGSGGCGSGGCG